MNVKSLEHFGDALSIIHGSAPVTATSYSYRNVWWNSRAEC
jgi:hypothetical protein